MRLDAGAALVAQKDLRRAGLREQRGEGAGLFRARALAPVHVEREAQQYEAAAAAFGQFEHALCEALRVPLGQNLRLAAEYAALVRDCDAGARVAVVQGHYPHLFPSPSLSRYSRAAPAMYSEPTQQAMPSGLARS